MHRIAALQLNLKGSCAARCSDAKAATAASCDSTAAVGSLCGKRTFFLKACFVTQCLHLPKSELSSLFTSLSLKKIILDQRVKKGGDATEIILPWTKE